MNNQELLTRPASKLTRKQRKERAGLKKNIAQELKLPAGRALGRFRLPYPPEDVSGRVAGIMDQRLPPGTYVTIREPGAMRD